LNKKREIVMSISRRAVLAAPAGLAIARNAQGARPELAVLTPELIEAAKKEGKIAWYTADDLVLATRVSKGFETKYGMTVQLERSGAERIYQRIAQEYGSDISAVDVATTSDLGHTVSWRASGWLAPYVPSETAKWDDKAIGPDGIYIVDKFTMVISGYNSRLVKAEDAPKSWNDLLDPKWKGKLAKAHPGYSGAITNETYALSHLLGWEYYEKLAKQGVLQVQSATDPPMRVAQGERAVMADAAEVSSLRLIAEGAPLVLVYPTEGVPVVSVGSVLMRKSPRQNAARLFMHFLASSECQQINMDNGSRSFDTTLAEPASWTPLSKIKLLFNDPADLAREAEEIKKHYSKIFGV
jgi:iron(III) transport system substrate-binding protein